MGHKEASFPEAPSKHLALLIVVTHLSLSQSLWQGDGMCRMTYTSQDPPWIWGYGQLLRSTGATWGCGEDPESLCILYQDEGKYPPGISIHSNGKHLTEYLICGRYCAVLFLIHSFSEFTQSSHI